MVATHAVDNDGSWRSEARRHVKRLFAFGASSAAGLTIDLLLFATLLGTGVSPATGSALSSAAAVTFVYFSSVRRTFVYRGRFILPLFAIYAAYQVLGITVATEAVSALVELGVRPLVSKLIILPLTFPANYLVMTFITARRGRLNR